MTFEDIMEAELVPNAPCRVQWWNFWAEELVTLYDSEWDGDRAEEAMEGEWFSSSEITEIFPDYGYVVFEVG